LRSRAYKLLTHIALKKIKSVHVRSICKDELSVRTFYINNPPKDDQNMAEICCFSI